jgi:hypothetical protein
VDFWAQIRHPYATEKISKRELAKQLGVSRGTVDRALEAERPPKYERKPAGSGFDAYAPRVRAKRADRAGLIFLGKDLELANASNFGLAVPCAAGQFPPLTRQLQRPSTRAQDPAMPCQQLNTALGGLDGDGVARTPAPANWLPGTFAIPRRFGPE